MPRSNVFPTRGVGLVALLISGCSLLVGGHAGIATTSAGSGMATAAFEGAARVGVGWTERGRDESTWLESGVVLQVPSEYHWRLATSIRLGWSRHFPFGALFLRGGIDFGGTRAVTRTMISLGPAAQLGIGFPISRTTMSLGDPAIVGTTSRESHLLALSLTGFVDLYPESSAPSAAYGIGLVVGWEFWTENLATHVLGL